MLTIFDWLDNLGIPNEPRKDKKVAQLALDVENLNSAQRKRMADRWMVFDKLDGVYALVACVRTDDGYWHVKHFGRSGKALSGCEQLDLDIELTLDKEWGDDKGFSFVVVSEVTSEGPLAKLSGYLTPTRKVDKPCPAGLADNFHEFLSLAEFIEGVAPRTALQRYESLIATFTELGLNDQIIPQHIGTYEEAEACFEFIVKDGGEGVIIRDPQAQWVAGKKDERQMKMKERIDYDCEIIGYCTGKKGSKYEQTVGKLLVAFRAFGDISGDLIILPVGSGLTDELRDKIMAHPASYLGDIVKIKAKSFTEFGNLREPVIEEWRHDKAEPDFPFALLGDWKTYTKAQCEWNHYDIS